MLLRLGRSVEIQQNSCETPVPRGIKVSTGLVSVIDLRVVENPLKFPPLVQLCTAFRTQWDERD